MLLVSLNKCDFNQIEYTPLKHFLRLLEWKKNIPSPTPFARLHLQLFLYYSAEKFASWKSHCQWKCRCICWMLKRITGIATATKDLKSNGKAKRSRICARASTGKSNTKKPRTKITAVTWSENGWKFGAYSIQIVRFCEWLSVCVYESECRCADGNSITSITGIQRKFIFDDTN